MNIARNVLHGEKNLVAGMRACLAGQYIASTLVSAYSLMDILTWLDLPSGHDEVTGKDFAEWADKYVVPAGSLECTGTDLYAARCGVLHSLTPDSRMSRRGEATRIVYSWGSKKPYPRHKLEQHGIRYVMLHVDTLCAAIEQGAAAFWKEIESDPERLAVINRRAVRLFRDDARLPEKLP
jgi:hypothetical protein